LRDPARIHKILSLLEEYWEANPDLRLCQIISNLTSNTNFSSDPYYLEDDVFQKLLEEVLISSREN
jgi:uncharacterized protein YihD (DUF1040 family)